FAYASLFSLGDPINNTRTFYAAYPYVTFVYNNGSAYGPWADAVDGYAGLRFAIAGELYYGWVRMDIAADGGSAIIKDYAYNATKETPIDAGAANVGIAPTAENNMLQVYSFGNILHVNSAGLSIPSQLKIVNTLGEVVKMITLTNSQQEIDLTGLSHSLYIVSVTDGGKIYSGKIVL
ncbi:MAG: T9SS type A sorting domain-containing protein, partial [Chitinophagales bacterium]|nr:T9SS type A sorting domain-containing protein [Chitinophagales bacterium]